MARRRLNVGDLIITFDELSERGELWFILSSDNSAVVRVMRINEDGSLTFTWTRARPCENEVIVRAQR